MLRLAVMIAVAVAAGFGAGCSGKDKDEEEDPLPPWTNPADQAAMIKKNQAAAGLASLANSYSGAAASHGDPGRAQFDGQLGAYSEPGGVYAGAAPSYPPRPPIQFTSLASNVPNDLAVAPPPTPYVNTNPDRYSGLRGELVRGGSDARVVDESISQSLRKGMDPLMTLAIGSQESGLRSNVTSPVGAAGAMQLMPGTACDLGVCSKASLYDAKTNVALGTTYYQSLLNKFGRVDVALAAYNAGPGAVDKYGGVPPYAETQDYVRKVLGYYQQYRRLLGETLSV